MKPEIEKIDMNDSTWRVVKREFIHRKNNISITFLPGEEASIQISKAAMKALGNPAYGHLLINPEAHVLALMGTEAKKKNSVLLRSPDSQDADATVPCKALISRIYDLMGWMPENKCVVRGRLMKTEPVQDSPVLVFDLDHTCMYAKEAKQREQRSIRPTEYSERFGLELSPANLLQAEGHPGL